MPIQTELSSRERLLATFITLAAISSPSGSEGELTSYLVHALEVLGLRASVDSHGNVSANFEGTGDPILLCGHMDTVPLGRGQQVSPTVGDDGMVRSDGTTILGADNKDNVAAILETLQRLVETKAKHRPIEVLFTVGEEQISRGARVADLSMLKAREAVISDVTGQFGDIVMAAPSCVNLTFTIQGVRAHVRHAEQGISAIEVAGELITHLPIKAAREQGVLLNVAHMAGGLNLKEGQLAALASLPRNTIPDQVVLYAQIRSLNHEALQEQVKVIELLVNGISAQRNVQIVCVQEVLCVGYKHLETSEFVQRVAQTIDMVNETHRFITSEGGSDGNVLNERGISTVVISSAHRNSHQPTEYLVVDELNKLADFYYKLVVE